MAQSDDDKRSPAYVPYGTLRNQLIRLSEGLPNRVDRSAFSGLAGGTQTQLVAALRFLGLIENGDQPSAALRQLVGKRDEAERRAVLREVFKAAYPEVFALNLKRATPEELRETMAKAYSVSGTTLLKAIRFFLAAAKDLEIETSSYLEKANALKLPTNGSRRRQKKAVAAVVETPPPAPARSGTSKVVNLASGGTLTLSAELDLFDLNAEDRKFIFGLIDKLEEYQKNASQPVKTDTRGEANGADIA